jgi:hypothetical protein
MSHQLERVQRSEHGESLNSRIVYCRSRQPTARVPSVARGTIFNGTLSELKYSNSDLICLIYLIVLFLKLLDFLS